MIRVEVVTPPSLDIFPFVPQPGIGGFTSEEAKWIEGSVGASYLRGRSDP